MSAKDAVKTQQFASLWIHVERGMNTIKNIQIWNGVVPLSLFSVVNQIWTVCAFLCSTQDTSSHDLFMLIVLLSPCFCLHFS